MSKDRISNPEAPEAERRPGVSRRRWLTAGGVVATGAGLSAITERPAAANSGDDLVLGQGNHAEARTSIYNSTAETTFFATAATDSGSVSAESLSGAVVGWTNVSSPGVRGYGETWNGVIGESPSVVGVVGRSTADAGVLGESTDSYGVVGRSTNLTGVQGQGPAYGVRGDSPKTGVWGSSTGTAGTYAGVEGTSTNNWGVHGTSTNATGVFGVSTKQSGVQGQGAIYGVRGTSPSTGVSGSSTGPWGFYAGVEGTSTDNWGVHGTSTTAPGVWGESARSTGVVGKSTNAEGVNGRGGTYGGQFQGTRAAIRLMPAQSAGAPTSGTHAMGELLCDSAGALWFCSKGGAPGTWKKVRFV
jgi:hypothetical protein